MREGICSPSANESRALVVLEPVNDVQRPRCAAPPRASFLAQLIASAEKFPQYSDKRRAVPQEADAAYRDTMELLRIQ
jgi:hypothetical protein